MRDLLGVDYFADVVQVTLPKMVNDMEPLTGLRGLQSLWLTNKQLQDLSPLAELAGLTNLKRLRIEDTVSAQENHC